MKNKTRFQRFPKTNRQTSLSKEDEKAVQDVLRAIDNSLVKFIDDDKPEVVFHILANLCASAHIKYKDMGMLMAFIRLVNAYKVDIRNKMK